VIFNSAVIPLANTDPQRDKLFVLLSEGAISECIGLELLDLTKGADATGYESFAGWLARNRPLAVSLGYTSYDADGQLETISAAQLPASWRGLKNILCKALTTLNSAQTQHGDKIRATNIAIHNSSHFSISDPHNVLSFSSAELLSRVQETVDLVARPHLHRCRWRFLRTARRGVAAVGVKPATRLSLSAKDLQSCDGNSTTMPHDFCLWW
jgi:hypothetical protein